MKIKLKFDFLEKVFVVFALLHVADALSLRSLFYGAEGVDLVVNASPLDPIMGATRYLIFLISAMLIFVHRRRVLLCALTDPILLLLILLSICSTYWSISPELTQRPTLLLFGWSLFGAYFAARYTLKEQLYLLGITMGAIVIICIAFIAVLPGAGIQGGLHAGAWRGVFWHKNSLGRFMSLSAYISLLISMCSSRKKKIVWLVLMALSILLLLLSTSKSPLIILFLVILAFAFYRTFRWDGRLFVSIACLVILLSGSVIGWLQGNFVEVVTSLGRDPSLSGRTDIWLAVLNKIYERPLLGYGLGAFWNEAGPARDVWKEIGFTASKSHNGFFDLGAELGLMGIALFLGSFFLAFSRAAKWARSGGGIDRFWPIIYLTAFLLYNQTEGPVVGSTFTWVVYVSTAFALKADLYNAQYSEDASSITLNTRFSD